MNIFDLTTTDTATVNLLHPATGKPLLMDDGRNMHAVVYGMDSKHFAAEKQAFNKRLLERLPNAGPDYVPTDEDNEFVDELNRNLIKNCVESILFEGPDGESCSVDEFFDGAPPLMIAQVKAAVESRANFMQA